MYKFSKDFVSLGFQQFKDANERAKVTGKLLAHYLASDKCELKGKTITFVGFSLGAQVVKSTLNRLFKLGRFDLVHNTYFMGSSLKIGKPSI